MNSPFAWPGGKRCLLGHLRTRIPAHRIYVEVFAGSAKLLFSKEPSQVEVVNDLNGEICNFFRVVKHRSSELAESLEHEIVHPSRFREIKGHQPATDLERALSFAYSTWYSYGAKGQHFAAASLTDLLRCGTRRPLDTVREVLEKTAERLRRVRIEQRDFAELIQRFDSPETFFYLDPPYVDYKPNARYEPLPTERRVELFDLLSKLAGSFLLSFDDCVEVRKLAADRGMQVETVETRYGLGSTPESRRLVPEVLITRTVSLPEMELTAAA